MKGPISGVAVVIRSHPDAELSQEQLQALQRRLVDERKKLSSSVRSIACVLNVRPDCSIHDLADAAAFKENQERNASLAVQQRERLSAIEAALERMEGGTYGVSENTGELIPFDRLLALPWARTTIDE